MHKGQIEHHLLRSYPKIAGVDEVGRGCLAGPVCAGAVILDYRKLPKLTEKNRNLIRDSKTLSAKQRGEILPLIRDELTLASAVSMVSEREIEDMGIVAATFKAMHQALAGLRTPYQFLLVDGHRPLEHHRGPQKSVVRGDHLCYGIAAASILAKEARDQHMRLQSEVYPGYGFESHVGYGTRKHLDALEKLGICQIHRRNFAPVSRYMA